MPVVSRAHPEETDRCIIILLMPVIIKLVWQRNTIMKYDLMLFHVKETSCMLEY